MQLCFLRPQFSDGGVYEFADLSMHLILPGEDHGFDPDQFVRQRLEQNARALEARGGLRHQCNPEFVGSQIDSLVDGSCLAQIVSADANAIEILGDFRVQRGMSRARHPVHRLVHKFARREPNLNLERMICRNADSKAFMSHGLYP